MLDALKSERRQKAYVAVSQSRDATIKALMKESGSPVGIQTLSIQKEKYPWKNKQ
ncbi:hypothetical protein KSF_005440 [Reticulibacter mediterranei]|uniref:Uncharacterized protein n=1 Tax=Reticulibacter mediterranei TaxID=2778369 RepID=A0A8J3IHT3_9CHLR|nr:hypothetical protein KSF_005440 [Reticulibacter mediterranei]